ncbi:transposase domain-containing protein [Mesorhizobium sp. M0306]|uniref:transposase domain-containing protein n=1 Tax=Mesorhizobium sp. M0306 TaxID=2956932 RepID=UPI003335A39B
MATCRLNDINPVAYLAETLDAIINGPPQSLTEELMPWRFRKTSSPKKPKRSVSISTIKR